MTTFFAYILPILLIMGEIVFMRKCLTPAAPRMVCLLAFVTSLIPIAGLIECVVLPIIVCCMVGDEDSTIDLKTNKFNDFWFN